MEFSEITMNTCINSTTKQIADHQKKYDFVPDNIKQMTMYNRNIVYSPSNFSNPIEYGISEHTFRVDHSFCKLNKIFVSNFVLETDSGLLSQSINNQTNQVIDFLSKDFYGKDRVNDTCVAKIIVNLFNRNKK